MTSPDINTLHRIKFVASDETPPGNMKYDGMTILAPPEWIEGMGSGPNDPGTLLGIHGYPRSDGPGITEYVMIGPLDPVTKEFIRTLPEAGEWSDNDARTQVRDVARDMLRNSGVPAADARDYIKRVHDAAVRNERARVAFPPPPEPQP